MLILVSATCTVGILRQRIATKFMVISYKNVPVGKRGSGPSESILEQWRGGLDQMDATKLPISGRSKLRPNKVALISKKKHRRPVRYQVDTGSLSQARDDVGLPHFTPCAGLKADKQPSRTGAVNEIIPEKRRGGIAENAAGSRWSVGPQNLGPRLIPAELKHQAADEQPVSIDDRSGDGRETRASARHGRLAPVNGAIGGIQRSDRLPHPDDKLAASTGENDHG